MADPFRDAARDALAAIFKEMGADARFTPVVGAAIDLKAIPHTADQVVLDQIFPGRTRQTGRRFALQRADVAVRPAVGDQLALLDDAGAVIETCAVTEEGMSLDPRQLLWSFTVGEPS